MSFTISDQSIRDLILENADQSLSIEASAGTGKTTLMSQSFVACLHKTGAPMEHMVAITFTEKAAQELQERIHSLLSRSKQPSIAAQIPQASISTIHAFCAKILKQQPFAVDLDPQFSLMDPIESSRFLKKCFHQFIEDNLASPESEIKEMLQLGYKLETLGAFFMSAYHKRPTPLEAIGACETFDVNEFYSLLLEQFSKHLAFAENNCVDFSDAAYLQILKIHTELQFYKDSSPLLKTLALLHRVNISPYRGTQKNWERPEHLKQLKEALKDLKIQHEDMQSRMKQQHLAKLPDLVGAFLDFVKKQKSTTCAIDFDDLLILTQKLLSDFPNICEQLQKQFKHFFIDEFQDTDPIQADIIWKLQSKSSSLFIVGDPKQSIYRFRGASIETYQTLTSGYKENNQQHIISQNFRSSPKLCSWINDFGRSLLDQNYSNIDGHPEHLPLDKPILKLETLEGEDAAHTRHLEASNIARWIQQTLANESQPRVFDKNLGQHRQAEAKDIAILFPTSTGTDQLEEALRNHSVPFAIEGGGSFFRRSEIEGLIHILEAVLLPSQEHSIVAALKSCYFALSDQDLLNIKTQHGHFNYRNIECLRSESPSVQFALHTLKTLHLHLHTLQAHQALQVMYEEIHAYVALKDRLHHTQAHANLDKMLQLAHHFEKKISHSLWDFYSWCKTMRASNAKEGEGKWLEDLGSEKDSQHVKLMTIHKSKGLEFPIVILCQLEDRGIYREKFVNHENEMAYKFGSGNLNTFSPNFEHAAEQDQEQLFDEKKRLLYVAATRAQDLLVLSTPHYKRPSKKSFLSLITNNWIEGHPLTQTLNSDELEQLQETNSGSEKVSEKLELEASISKLNTEHTFAPLYQKYINSEDPDKANLKLSSSMFYFEQTQGSAKGNWFHHIMQHIQKSWTPKAIKSFVHACLIHPSHKTFEHDLYAWALQATQQSFWLDAVQGDQMLREFSLAHGEANDTSEASEESVIDLIYKHNNSWHIVDYKTDKQLDEEALKKYRLQLQNYAALFEKTTQNTVESISLYHAPENKVIKL